MAKKEKSATSTSTSKNNSAGKKRSTADLKGSEKGKIILVIRNAASLANNKNREGLDLGAKNSAKNLAGRLNSVVKPGGKVDMLDAGGDAYKQLLAKAKAAIPSLKGASYDANVKGLLTYVLTALTSSGGGGRKGFNPNALADISL